MRYFGQHGLASNPWHPGGATPNPYVPVRHLPRPATLWLVGCALVPLLAGGCGFDNGVSRVWEVTPSTFNNIVLGSEQPVLVNFYKPG